MVRSAASEGLGLLLTPGIANKNLALNSILGAAFGGKILLKGKSSR
jgi:hypothetical protein